MYIPTDPREALVERGNALLEVIYQKHIWEQTYPLLDSTMAKGMDATHEEMEAVTRSESFVEALLSRMTLESDAHRIHAEYILLRETVEALTGPRQPMSSEEL
jgi:hypothetical protein